MEGRKDEMTEGWNDRMMEGRTKQTLNAPLPFYGGGIKMASRQDRFCGIKIPGFFCPVGTYGMYASHISLKKFFSTDATASTQSKFVLIK